MNENLRLKLVGLEKSSRQWNIIVRERSGQLNKQVAVGCERFLFPC